MKTRSENPQGKMTRTMVAKALGVTVATVRRLEEKRVLTPTRDKRTGYWMFDPRQVNSVRQARSSALFDGNRRPNVTSIVAAAGGWRALFVMDGKQMQVPIACWAIVNDKREDPESNAYVTPVVPAPFGTMLASESPYFIGVADSDAGAATTFRRCRRWMV